MVAERPERKIILVTDDGEELRVALVEDGRLSEIYIERPDRKSYLGDIYQGKVENVMSGIDAAFVDFGLEKNGFLYVDEVTTPEGEKRARRITDALKNGQQVLVQVIKDPMGHKGARLSTKISLAGRYLVYVPGGSGVGVSRRLKQGERERLRDISKELKPKDAGLIVRTIAEGHGLEDLKRDMRYLARLWSRLKKKSETVKAPGLVHKEVDISLEVTRDLFNDTCESLIVDDPKRHKAILSFLDKEAPELLPKVHLHTGEEPLFLAYGIDDQIAKALERRVPLPSGGNLMIDHAEALTVIDVNTGRFTRGKGLEDTITKTNLEAAREVVRQLRLRDIGGIIIIDFIDMAHAKNREMVLATLEAELETDRTKTYVVELSPLGLVEMTRQNTTDGARGILTRACPTCSGKGARAQRGDHGAERRAPRARPGAQVAGQGVAHRGQRRRGGAPQRRAPQAAREADRAPRVPRGRLGAPGRVLPRDLRGQPGARGGAARARARGPGGHGRARVQPHLQPPRRGRLRRRLHGDRRGRPPAPGQAPQGARHRDRPHRRARDRAQEGRRIDPGRPFGYHFLPLS